MHKLSSFALLVTIFLSIQGTISFAQGGEGNKIVLSGLVVEGDSSFGVVGAHIYIPKASIGTVSNKYGYFGIPVKAGDSILISFISYQDIWYQVPIDADSSYAVLVNMTPSNTVLASTTVYPFPTKELFKQAFMEVDLHDERLDHMEKHLNDQAMRRMASMVQMDGVSNHNYYMKQYAAQQGNQFFAPTFSLLNPFAWSRFVQSIKRGDFKNQDSDR